MSSLLIFCWQVGVKEQRYLVHQIDKQDNVVSVEILETICKFRVVESTVEAKRCRPS